jgi:peptidoglycan/xylan/chitin deacetylase (PgdA/CDA1 family)
MIAFQVKKIFSAIAKQSGMLSYNINKCAKSSSLILMYHRVFDPEETGKFLEAGMYVTPKTFESHILFLKNYFKISSLEVFVSKYKVDLESPSPPRCVLTFDDGWRDFYINVFPLLKKYQVPATVFLPTDFIGSEKWFWTDRLAHLIGERGEAIRLDAIGCDIRNPIARQLNRVQGSPHARLDKAIRILKSCSQDTIEMTISDLSEAWGIRANPSGRAFLSWEEVGELSRSGFVQFGSHTASHQILPTLDDETVRHELDSSRSELISRKAVDPGFIPFCYPNGSMDERIVNMVREAGYGAAVTTMRGWNPHKADPFILKRVGIHQDMTSNTAMLGCRIAGLI